MNWKLPGLGGIVLGFALGVIGRAETPALDLVPHKTLRVNNPTGVQVRLLRRRGDATELVANLGSAATMERRLPCGKYWLEAAGHRYPAPLLEQLPASQLDLTVSPLSPAPAGMVAIPAGPSLQGDELGIGQPDEGPCRTVSLPAFALGTREVTNGEFVRFLNAGESPERWIALDSATCRIHFDPATKKLTSDAPELPVVNVSWDGARAYCAWLAKQTGRPYRLPSEAEWEKAARGPESCVFAYGDRYRPDGANQESGCLRPAGTFAANGWGLHDMTGNAYEWCADRYAGSARAGSAHAGSAHAGSAHAGAADVARQSSSRSAGVRPYRVLRGGSFVLDGVYMRNSFRMRYRPTVMSDDIGFRVAMDLQPQDNQENVGASR